MNVADVTGVAWQQMCVSSWQGLAALPVSGGGWTYSSIFSAQVSISVWLSLSVCYCFSDCLTDSRCQQMPLYTERSNSPFKVNWTSSKHLSCQIKCRIDNFSSWPLPSVVLA